MFQSSVLSQQVERTTLSNMLRLGSPSLDKIYRITDTDKEGDWQYFPDDNRSLDNIGTILESNNPRVNGRFKRMYNPAEGVNIEWFSMSSLQNTSINQALFLALKTHERINFANKIYIVEPIQINSTLLTNPARLVFNFQNTTLKAKAGLTKIRILELFNITDLSLLGNLILDGDAKTQKIQFPLQQAGEAFLHIIAPSNKAHSQLTIGTITFQNMPMCGINIFTENDAFGKGYNKIEAKAFREINGFNYLNIQQEDFPVWGLNIRGAHQVVVIDSLYARQDNEPWGDAPIEKPFYTFTFENQVDPKVHQRKDSVWIKNLYAEYPCAIVLYTQAPNHVLIDNYFIINALRKPKTDNWKAYPTMLRRNISWIGSKHTWTSYQQKNSSFTIKKLLIKDTNPVFMNESATNDMTGLWLNKGIEGAKFDAIDTDVRLKFYGDGVYFGFTDVPEGNHQIRNFTSRIPAKRNYVQPLNADITIQKLHLAKESGVTFAMGNAYIKSITQENGSKAIFENRENKFKTVTTRYNGFVVDSCRATNILWKFSWNVQVQQLADEQRVMQGERYEFKNFTGNNFLQIHTNVGYADGKQTYVSAYKYDADATVREAIKKFLPFVEFKWYNVTMRLADPPANNIALRYFPIKSKTTLLNTDLRSRRFARSWRQNWQPNSFEKTVIVE